MSLSATEKARVRHHLGYPQVGAQYTFSLGMPSDMYLAPLIEGAMDRLIPAAEPEVRRIVAVLDKIECGDIEDLDNIGFAQVGEIAFMADGDKKRVAAYKRWQGALSNLLNCPPNPHDQRFANSGINARVNH